MDTTYKLVSDLRKLLVEKRKRRVEARIFLALVVLVGFTLTGALVAAIVR